MNNIKIKEAYNNWFLHNVDLTKAVIFTLNAKPSIQKDILIKSASHFFNLLDDQICGKKNVKKGCRAARICILEGGFFNPVQDAITGNLINRIQPKKYLVDANIPVSTMRHLPAGTASTHNKNFHIHGIIEPSDKIETPDELMNLMQELWEKQDVAGLYSDFKRYDPEKNWGYYLANAAYQDDQFLMELSHIRA